jgi:membrane protein implicated in regulation of membrane protease activity
MLAFLQNLNGLELLFACCAVFGAVLFFIRLVLMFVGHAGDAGGDMDAGAMHDIGGGDAGMGADVGADGGHDFSGHDSDLSFKTLSLQGITAFFMMFGLVGWAVVRQGNYAAWIPILCGTAAGLITVWVMKKIFQFATSLQSNGTLNLQNAVGQEGTVYLTVKPGKAGKVQITVQDRYSILEAVTEKEEELKTGQTVRVVKVIAGKLVVEKSKP